MTTHEFSLIVDRNVTDEELDALFAGGCDDSTPEIGNGRTSIHFHRDDETLAGALVSAVRDVEAAGVRVAGVASDDLVTLREIAARVGRTHESVRLLVAGRRGPGGFPSARNPGEHARFWSWATVRPWFAEHFPASLTDGERFEYERLVAAADLLVRARALTRDDSAAAPLLGLVA